MLIQKNIEETLAPWVFFIGRALSRPRSSWDAGTIATLLDACLRKGFLNTLTLKFGPIHTERKYVEMATNSTGESIYMTVNTFCKTTNLDTTDILLTHRKECKDQWRIRRLTTSNLVDVFDSIQHKPMSQS